MTTGQLVYGLEERGQNSPAADEKRDYEFPPFKVVSVCNVTALGDVWEWGLWTEDLTATEALQAEFREIANAQ
jgi:hypothetical protein